MPPRNTCQNDQHHDEHPTCTERAVADNILPWADPYVAGLLLSHQRQAALNDSLSYLALQEAERFGPTDAAWRH